MGDKPKINPPATNTTPLQSETTPPQANEAQNQAPIEQTEATPKSKGKKKVILWVFVVLLLLFSIGITTLLLINQKRASQTQQPSPIETKPTPTHAPNDDLVSWKTHRNEKHGFELAYPDNYFSNEYFSGNGNGKKFGVSFADKKWEGQGVHNPSLVVRVIATELSPREWLEENYDPAVLPSPSSDSEPPFGYRDVQDTTVNGMAAIQFQFLTTSDTSENTLIQGNSDTLYRITAISSGIGNFSQELYNQILSTFKLLRQQSFTCPTAKIIDCMPGGISPEMAKYCTEEYAQLIQENCPEVLIVY